MRQVLSILVLIFGLAAAAPLRAEGNDLEPRQTQGQSSDRQPLPPFRLCLPYLPYLVDISRLWRSGIPEHRYTAALSLLAVGIRSITCR